MNTSAILLPRPEKRIAIECSFTKPIFRQKVGTLINPAVSKMSRCPAMILNL